MASDSVLLRVSLERLRMAMSAANSQALERERLRLVDVSRVQEAFFDLLDALVAVKPAEPPPVVTPSVGTAAGATIAQAAALIAGAATVPGKPPQPSVDGLDFSSLSPEFSSEAARWATPIVAVNASLAAEMP
jgi:hypothetical protein